MKPKGDREPHSRSFISIETSSVFHFLTPKAISGQTWGEGSPEAGRQAATSEEFISQSKTAAEAIIAAFFAELGWSIEVRCAEGKEATAAKAR